MFYIYTTNVVSMQAATTLCASGESEVGRLTHIKVKHN